MTLERVSLFSKKRDFFIFVLLCGFIFIYSLLIEYQTYKNLTRFDTTITNAIVLKQYFKTKNSKTYQILKLKSSKGFVFYTTAKKSLPNIKGRNIKLKIWAEKKSFYEYLTTFFAYSKILHINNEKTFKQKLNSFISKQHENKEIANLYQALYTAVPLNKHLQFNFSTMGVSHLFAISGFHLGVLSTMLFFLFKYPYSFFQNRYFPYRNSKSDLFITIATILLLYLLFLGSPASLLRAFTMLIVGFFLYDRGIKIISMQTLLLTVILLLSFFPKLVFSLGFWLSISGVFYIFLFLIHFKHLNKITQFILIPFWVYILMLPFSLSIFGNFSNYHPLSILWTSLFTLFYPLSILLHIINFGNLFDNLLESFINLGTYQENIYLPYKYLALHVVLSLLGIWKKTFLWIVIFYAISIFIYAMSVKP